MQQMLKTQDIQYMLNISRSQAYSLANSGAFPVVRIGRAIRIPRETFEAWIRAEAEKQAI